MSGIVGIFNLDGAPADRTLLERMTNFMTFCGPDKQNIWLNSAVGLGHTLLRTTFEAEHEQQPFTFDGQVWIVADARVDGRSELINKLQAKGQLASLDRPDVALILHAYQVWGEQCVDQLIGDFVFAIWDERKQRLFCARDHWGVKPFFYAKIANCLIFSNVLNCVRIHPHVSDKLNDLFIGDFLLFGASQEFDNTAFVDIQRLAPAHTLTCTKDSIHLHRYWSLPFDIPIIQYKRDEEYVEHFRELLNTAVADRLRADRVAAEMSGGLDSTSVVATALREGVKQSSQFDLQAFAVVYDYLIPDQERYYAGLAANALNIPIHFIVGDDNEPFSQWQPIGYNEPEPTHNPTRGIYLRFATAMAQQSRVVITGWDGDTILSESVGPYFGALIRSFQWKQAASYMGRYLLSQRRLPPVGLRTWLKRRQQKSLDLSQYPVWLNRSFEDSLSLKSRWEEFQGTSKLEHSIRSKAYKVLNSPLWVRLFESYKISDTQSPLEIRHPLADLRLVLFALSLPLSPWIVDKHMLRLAMFGVLPEAIRRRPKTPLAKDPLTERLKNGTVQSINNFTATAPLATYVDQSAIPQVTGGQDSNHSWLNLRPLSLNYWLEPEYSNRLLPS